MYAISAVEGRRAAGDHQGCDLAQLIAAACGPRLDAKHTAGAALRERVADGYGGEGRAGRGCWLETVFRPRRLPWRCAGNSPMPQDQPEADVTTPDSPARSRAIRATLPSPWRSVNSLLAPRGLTAR